MSSELSSKNTIFFYEDYPARELNESKVGRKGLSLFKLKDMDVPVPEFFVVSSDVFTDFCLKAFEDNPRLLKKGRNPEGYEIESALLKQEFDKSFSDDVASAYARLSGFTDAWVSVRSSVVFPNDKSVSFNGIFSTELNVRKYDELLTSIKRIYASMFTDDVVAYASRMNITLSDVKLSVVVQKMVQSEVSGVAFTVDPITQDETKLSIEAVYGLGDVIALGEVAPDSYLLDKKDLSILEKHIAPQEWMKVRTIRQSGKSSKSTEKIKISPNWSHRQKLRDSDIEEVCKIALVIEDKSREVQNVEWVLSGGRFWVLQNKPLYESLASKPNVMTVAEDLTQKNLREVLLAFIDKYKSVQMITSSAMNSAKKLVEKGNNDNANKKLDTLIYTAKRELDTELHKSAAAKKESFVLTGIGASFGTAIGCVKIVDKPSDVKLSRKDILVIKEYSSEMEAMILACGGVIMDSGGLTCDTAILCREFNIPAVVGAMSASTLLKDGDVVKIDGNVGSVYKEYASSGDDTIHPVVDSYASGEVKVDKDLDIQHDSVPPYDSSLAPSATKVFTMGDIASDTLFNYVGNSHGIVYVDLDKLMLEDGKHIMKYVEDRKFVDYTKRIANRVLDYVNLAMGNEVVVSIGSATVKSFRNLVGGKKYENEELSGNVYGAVHYVNNPEMLKRICSIVRRVRNVYKKRNVSLAIHSPMNDDVMKDIKKILSGEKLGRTSSFKIYAILDNPGEIILADEIARTRIDGLILNMPRIARLMQGFKIDQSGARYDLARNSVFRVLDSVINSVSSMTEEIIVIVENCKPLLKYCIEAGVYGVSVSPEDVKEARKVVSDVEKEIILGK